MTITTAHAYLVHPGKNASSPTKISGKQLAFGTGKLFDMMTEVFGSNPNARDFEVTFNANSAGKQSNECRDLMVAYQANPTLANGDKIASRLQISTDNRSGIGLLFLLSGTMNAKHRLVVSRFPTDQAVLAEVASSGFDVKFLEQVFIKRLSSYKALLLEHATPANGFWSGSATDRQAGGAGENISEYWLNDFLDADFSETPAAGTRRLANALKQAIKANPSLTSKGEIASASSLAASVFKGKTTSIKAFCQHFGFSIGTVQTIQAHLQKSSLYDKSFKFDSGEFKTIAPYRTVELNTGAILTAPNDEFENVFVKSTNTLGDVKYIATGRINDQRLTKK